MAMRVESSLEGFMDSPMAFIDHLTIMHEDDTGHFIGASVDEAVRIHNNLHTWGSPGHTHEG